MQRIRRTIPGTSGIPSADRGRAFNVITLYQLHWSHYVEKVRWALDFKGVEWSAVDVDPFDKRQMLHLKCRTTLDSGAKLYTVPAIHDEATGTVVGDSSEILGYLERAYPSPALYPAEPMERDEVARWMLWLDSALGLPARRLAYTQITMEHPGLLSELFVPRMVGEGGRWSVKGRLAGAIIGGVLAQRFRFLHNRADRVFEQLEQALLSVAARMKSRACLVGERFTAADITLAALLRPITLVPFFRSHPDLQRLFEWRDTQLKEHHRQSQGVYEEALHEVRRRRGWALGAVSWIPQPTRDDGRTFAETPAIPTVRNDQQPIGRLPVLGGLLSYLKLKRTCGLGRTSYP